jgi:pimeloyl-ACP methyl ester carboxylesterase
MAQVNNTDFFNSGSNRLCGVCTIPQGQVIKAGLIFVHAADGNRLGPHRMFVEIADKLKYCSITSLRFDMRGCGDSEGEPSRNDINPDIEDLFNAVNFFVSTYKPQKIFLLGISRGALVCISALAKHNLPVNGAILLSTPFSSSKIAAKKFKDCLKEYLYKFKNPENIKKLLLGKANVKQILKTHIFALTSARRYRRNNHRFITKCPLFFIYGSKDPIAADSAVYYRSLCEKYKIPFEITEIQNANHSFFHYLWKEQIMKITEKWLMENIRGEEDGSLV